MTEKTKKTETEDIEATFTCRHCSFTRTFFGGEFEFPFVGLHRLNPADQMVDFIKLWKSDGFTADNGNIVLYSDFVSGTYKTVTRKIEP